MVGIIDHSYFLTFGRRSSHASMGDYMVGDYMAYTHELFMLDTEVTPAHAYCEI